jgi:hypothetical protein
MGKPEAVIGRISKKIRRMRRKGGLGFLEIIGIKR